MLPLLNPANLASRQAVPLVLQLGIQTQKDIEQNSVPVLCTAKLLCN